jgi:hypothetical protein
MATKRARRKPPVRQYTLAFEGDLAPYSVVMGPISGRDIIRIRNGISDAETLELLGAHVLEHDFDVPDILELDYQLLLDIAGAWMRSVRDAALPPASGDS